MFSLTQSVASYGLPLVIGVVLLEQLGLPIPAIPVLVVAGALAVDGKLAAWQILFGAVAASVAADSLWFALGRVQGNRILKTLCRISLSPDSCVRQTEAVFERYGMPSLLLAKFIPGFSTVARRWPAPRSPPADVSALRLGRRAPVGGRGFAAGMLFHRAVDRVIAAIASLGSGALVLLGAGLAVFIALKWWQRRRFYRMLRMARISVEELRSLMDQGKSPVVVDVRTPGAPDRDPRRIPGAVVLAASELDARLAELPRDREIILYCT